MIVFTKLYNARALNDSKILAKLLGYVKRKTYATPEEWRGLFWMSGYKLTSDRREELRRMEMQFQKNRYVQMIVFSPLRSLKPELLAKYTEDAMWRFFKMANINSAKFAYGLHFNTKHHHTHVIMTSWFEKDINYSKQKRMIYTLHDAAHLAFDEPIGSLAYNVYGREVFKETPTEVDVKKYGKKEYYEEHMKAMRKEFRDEEEEMLSYEEVGSIDDVYDMEI